MGKSDKDILIVDINKVKPNPKNPRIIKDEKFNKLVKSIKDFPDMLNKRPLIVFTDKDKKLVVLGGNMRLKACQQLGINQVPVIIADEWTEEQKQEFLIKDNVGFGEWDFEQLANEWDSQKLNEWGLDIPKFESEDSIIESSEYSDTSKWFLNIEFENEQICQKWYEKLINEGLICKIVQ